MAAQPKFTDQELKKYREIFDRLDTDHDGKLSHQDLKSALDAAGWGLSDREVEFIIQKADKDGTGTINWDEFLKVAEGRPIKRRIEAALRRVFRAMDTDGSGYITSENLRQLLTEAGAGDDVTDDELKQIIAKADKTGDGKISFEEFLAHFIAQNFPDVP